MQLFSSFDSVAEGAFLLPGIDIERVTTPAVHQTAAATLEHHRLQRELLAVLIGDVAGYSRLIERNDVATVVRLRHLRRHLVEPETAARGGRLVRFVGDSMLAAFGDAPAAIDCALAIQRGASLLNRGIASTLHLRLRIGISFGAALVDDDGDLHGPAVNVASRLEMLAEPGGIYLTGAAFDRLIGRSGLRCEALGVRRLRHITEPVRVHRVVRSELARPPAATAQEHLLAAV
jgi:adenylate cyclase